MILWTCTVPVDLVCNTILVGCSLYKYLPRYMYQMYLGEWSIDVRVRVETRCRAGKLPLNFRSRGSIHATPNTGTTSESDQTGGQNHSTTTSSGTSCTLPHHCRLSHHRETTVNTQSELVTGGSIVGPECPAQQSRAPSRPLRGSQGGS